MLQDWLLTCASRTIFCLFLRGLLEDLSLKGLQAISKVCLRYLTFIKLLFEVFYLKVPDFEYFGKTDYNF